MAHTSSFEEAITVVPEGPRRYAANLSSAWAVGDVPHGGYLAALLYRATKTHFSRTHPTRHGGRAEPINMQLTFVRRCQVGPARLDIEDIKLGERTSVIRVVLSQPGRDATARVEKLVGTMTVSNLKEEEGLTLVPCRAPGRVGTAVEVLGLGQSRGGRPGESTSAIPWRRAHIPHPEFRRAPAHVEVYSPEASGLGPRHGTDEQWATLRWSESESVVQCRWTGEAAVFLLDIFPTTLARLEREVNESEESPAPVWFPTLAMTIDLRRSLPEEGVEWLFSLVTVKEIRGGRMDVEIALLDESGDLVASACHSALILSSSRNRAKL